MTDTSEGKPTAAGTTVVTGKEASAHEAGEHGAHPTDKQYMQIALILGTITAVEVAVSYIKGLGDASAPLLLIMAAAKFFLVAAYFMHLKFDTPVLRRIFVTGIILAMTVYIVVFFTLGIFTTAHGVHG